MKNQYKAIFSKIHPDEELLNSVLRNQFSNHKKYFPLITAACISVCIAGLCLLFAADTEFGKSEIDVPVAYETKLQPESEKHISKYIYDGKTQIKIDADVIIEGNVNDLKIYGASVRKFSEYMISDILLSENGLFWGDKNSSGIFETELGGMTFDIGIDMAENNIEKSMRNDYADGCTFSYSEAKNIADDFMKKANLNEYLFKEGRIEKSFSPFYGNWRSGFYIFRFCQYADGFAVETVTDKVDSDVASNLSIKIDNEGIVGLNMFGLILTEEYSLQGNIFSIEDAIGIIEKNIGDLWLSEYAPIVEIRLEYILDKKENKSLELVPCWHFCIDQTELKSLDIETQRNNDTNDLCVNAVTGEIYRVADRYPVFQTSYGIIGTWKK